MDLSVAKYRITYEAFSKFSGNLSKADSVTALAEVACKNLKYLFNFKLFRLLLIDEWGRHNVFTFYKGQVSIELKSSYATFHYEEEILKTQIPLLQDTDCSIFKRYLKGENIAQAKLWGWLFDYNNYKVCASVLASEGINFSYNDVEILQLLADSFTTKYRQINLSEELRMKNKNLQSAVKEIEKKNQQINKINDNQQQIILERTEELRCKNAKLRELSKVNAHSLREPLSRILGILEISEHYDAHQIKEELLPFISISALELDITLRDVVARSEMEIKKLSVD